MIGELKTAEKPDSWEIIKNLRDTRCPFLALPDQNDVTDQGFSYTQLVYFPNAVSGLPFDINSDVELQGGVRITCSYPGVVFEEPGRVWIERSTYSIECEVTISLDEYESAIEGNLGIEADALADLEEKVEQLIGLRAFEKNLAMPAHIKKELARVALLLASKTGETLGT